MDNDIITLTTEQRGIVKSNAPYIVVEAFAGATKSFTLEQYARARPHEKMLYVAFTKAIQLEAESKFPPNVQCKTTHALAYPYTGRIYQKKAGLLRPNDVMRFFGVPVLLASQVVDTVESFLSSADDAIADNHAPADLAPVLRAKVVDLARQVWAEMKNLDNQVIRMTHDGYLKLFQLSKPDLSQKYNAILFDEYQDANPCTVAIYARQRCKKVLVGDRHQSIFAFRRAVNAFGMIQGSPEYHSLTHSFRFGEGVAYIANQLLQTFKGESKVLVGRGPAKMTELKVDRSQQYAVICRTNAKVFANAVACLNKKKVHFVGGIDNYPLAKLLDVYGIWNKEPHQVSDAFFKTFRDFESLEEYAKAADDKEILSLIGVVREFRQDLPDLVAAVRKQACVEKDDADVLLTTAHRAKGLAFRQVVLEDDFEELVDEQGNVRDLTGEEFEQEVNMLYVALTRATHALELNKTIFAFLAALKRKNAAAPAAAEVAAPTPAPAAVVGTAKVEVLHVSASEQKDLEEAVIEECILRKGLLSAQAIARSVGLSEDSVAATIVTMILGSRLSHILFQRDEVVMARLRAIYGVAA